jgi:hypothetical protein
MQANDPRIKQIIKAVIADVRKYGVDEVEEVTHRSSERLQRELAGIIGDDGPRGMKREEQLVAIRERIALAIHREEREPHILRGLADPNDFRVMWKDIAAILDQGDPTVRQVCDLIPSDGTLGVQLHAGGASVQYLGVYGGPTATDTDPDPVTAIRRLTKPAEPPEAMRPVRDLLDLIDTHAWSDIELHTAADAARAAMEAT